MATTPAAAMTTPAATPTSPPMARPAVQNPRQVRATPEKLVQLQSNTPHIRNICILAHVDHGKTTLSDCLLASNGIISSKLAGKIRYLDSREDEQLRGITMESSAISLYFNVIRKTDDAQQSSEYLINLIDSPGHVDFSSEVSTASRLCDGGLVLVDVVEGVCTQTITVLRQAWLERVRPILVFNKMDRLITELRLTPSEAYTHLSRLLEQVNAVMGSFFASELVEEDMLWRERKEQANGDKTDVDEEYQEKDDEDIYFAPEKGNVVFASAVDGWAFRINSFAQLYSTKLGIKESILRKCLWGDFYLDPKTKRVLQQKHLKGRNLKPMFVQFVLDNVWAVYDSVVLNPNSEKVQKIVTALNLKLLPRDLRSKDTKVLLSAVFSQWLPLSTTVLLAVIEHLPSPDEAQRIRMPKLLHPELHDPPSEPKDDLERALYACDKRDATLPVAYVSKMILVDAADMPENQRRAMTSEEMRAAGKQAREAAAAGTATAAATETATGPAPTTDSGGLEVETDQIEEVVEEKAEQAHHLIGFGRLYSGTLHVGQRIQVLGPKFDGAKSTTQHASETTITGLYMLMGREMVRLESVPAGNVIGIGGLEGKVLKSGSVFGAEAAPSMWRNLGGVAMATNPIVRIALEVDDPRDMPKLVEGLKLLNQADPCVEVLIEESGEHVILTAGELHLERCLKDLRERFAKCAITSSKPIVPFRETVVSAMDMVDLKDSSIPRGLTTILTPSGKNVSLTLRVVPLPAEVTAFLTTHTETLKRMRVTGEGRHKSSGRSEAASGIQTPHEDIAQGADASDLLLAIDAAATSGTIMNEETFWTELEQLFKKAGSEWSSVDLDRVWAFGPKGIGANILFDKTTRRSIRNPHKGIAEEMSSLNLNGIAPKDFDEAVHTAFQLATFKGPLCAEPVVGTACFIEDLHIVEAESTESLRSKMGVVSGAVISATRDAYKTGFLEWSPRLMLAMYKCDIQASADVLGKVYATVARHRGNILGEEMKEGTPFFSISASLPVVESFGFGDDIRRRTSGAASPQLIFSGFEMLDQDPFWVPTTEEELEDLGEKADRENIAKRYMDEVRKRKGMFVERKIVEHAEKQRTMKR